MKKIKIEICINNKKSAIFVDKNSTILDVLISNNINFIAPCGGNNKCHNCKVEILLNNVRKTVLACSTLVEEGMIIFINQEVNNNYDNKLDLNTTYDLCLDLGTTTLVFAFIDININSIVKEISLQNPQSKFGLDVISRIDYSNKNSAEPLYFSINNITKEIISNYKIRNLFVCGNPTMLHLFLNKDVRSLGEYPYNALFLDQQILKGKELNLNIEKVVLLPSFSSYVGADLLAGSYYTDLDKDNNLLIDLGTNGEMVLHYNNKIYVTSTAAGPAFEGIGIECGVGAIDGAINHIEYKNNKFICSTINNKKPIGIVGSGLVELINLLKSLQFLDETGKLLGKDNKIYLTDDVYISQKDIRAFQLAKSAIRTGIELLLESACVKYEDLKNVYIAGGFGQYLDIEAAINIGLIPNELKDKCKSVGNSALKGVIKYIFNQKDNDHLNDLSKNAIIIELNKCETFLDKFTDNMSL